MRGVDARAVADLGIPGPTLMENAGRGAAEALLAALPERGLRTRGLRVAIVCGRGGNGGDGFVVARRLKRAGARPDVLLTAPPDGAAPEGPVVRAWLTPTFAAAKLALVLGPGVELAGRVSVVPIGVPEPEVARDARTFVLEASDVAPLFPRRPRDVHKGTYGHLLVVAGSLGKTGAAALCARGALRSGVGLVTVATAASAQPTVAALSLEAMTEALPETAAHTLAVKAREPLAALTEARDAVAIGPGLGLDHETRGLVRDLVGTLARPMVVDADALTALGDHLHVLRGVRAARVLTPHPGEMARLIAGTVDDVQRDRLGAARTFATTHGRSLVLKGT